MTRDQRDKVFLADCLMEGGAIRKLAEYAIDAGWSARKFRVACEFCLVIRFPNTT